MHLRAVDLYASVRLPLAMTPFYNPYLQQGETVTASSREWSGNSSGYGPVYILHFCSFCNSDFDGPKRQAENSLCHLAYVLIGSGGVFMQVPSTVTLGCYLKSR